MSNYFLCLVDTVWPQEVWVKFLSQMPLKEKLSPGLVPGTPASELIKMQIPGLPQEVNQGL